MQRLLIKQTWLSNPKVGLYAVFFSSLWAGIGQSMILFLAGLQSVSVDVLEADKIDGATSKRTFFTITIPLMKETFIMVIATLIIAAMKVYDIVKGLTDGGPSNSTQMLPMQTALVPINVIFSKLGLLNTYGGLFYVYVGFGISFGILILRGFFKGIPKDIDEAAYIDGCTKWQLFCKIIFPLAKPAVATLVISDFLATWNEYLLASVIINDNKMKTVPVGLMTFVGEHGTDYGFLCAGVLISVVPVLVVYLIFQKNFVEGMAGAVKS